MNSRKQSNLKARKAEDEALERRVNVILSQAGEPQPGCGICILFRRAFTKRGMTDSQKTAIFGTKASSASAKLSTVAEKMETKVNELEERIAAERARASALHKKGDKAGALRAMKSLKKKEQNLSQHVASLAALEQQSDLLENAELQKSVASALSATAKGLTKQKKLMKRAEEAVDGATEARDLADDLNAVMGELAPTTDLDEDDLMAELDAMVAEEQEQEEEAEQEAEVVEDAARQAEIEMLEAKIAKAELKAKFPKTPKSAMKKASNKKEEKQVLLMAAV